MSNDFNAVVNETEREYNAISDEIESTIIEAINASTDYESFQKELDRLYSTWAPNKIALHIATASYKARLRGAGL
jgi:phage gp29-like protein